MRTAIIRYAPRAVGLAVESVMPAPHMALLHAGETPALPGGAGTRPVVARQEHARTTVGCPGMHPDHQDLI
jgi:hypothetical protein